MVNTLGCDDEDGVELNPITAEFGCTGSAGRSLADLFLLDRYAGEDDECVLNSSSNIIRLPNLLLLNASSLKFFSCSVSLVSIAAFLNSNSSLSESVLPSNKILLPFGPWILGINETRSSFNGW